MNSVKILHCADIHLGAQDSFLGENAAKRRFETLLTFEKIIETAKQQAEAVINEAKAYENAKLPQAQATADQLIQNAEYLKQKRVNEAKEQVAMFTAMYEEYKLNPAITKSRMYYETVSKIFPELKIYINTGDSAGMNMLLPLDQLTGGAN